jgi:hypothetical protein
VDNLADDVLVGEANDEAVLGRIVLVLGLGDQPLTGIVVGCELLDFNRNLNGLLDTYSFPACGACT